MSRPEETRQPNVADALLSSSGMVRWLHHHSSELNARQRNGNISWKTLAHVLAAEGILDDQGKAPSAGTLKRAWYRMRHKPITLPAIEPAPAAIATEKTELVAKPAPPPPASEPMTKPQFALAKLRNVSNRPAEPVSKTGPAPTAPQVEIDPDQVLRDAGFNI